MGRPKFERPNYRLVRGPAGIWIIKWTENRVPRSYSTRTRDQAEARILADQWIALREAPSLPAVPTVNDILDHYLAERKDQVSSYDTLVNSCKPLRKHLGNLQPDQISRKLYWERRRKDRVGKKPHPVGDGTIIREGVTLRAAFELAAADRLISRNDVPTITLPSAPGPRVRWLTREEARKLRAGAVARHIKLFIELGLATGGRKEALETLRWEQVDFAAGIIALSLPGRVASRKRRAVVAINDELMAALIEAKEAATCDYVIERASKPVGDVKKGFAAAVKRAGIDHCTPHALRHTCATWMVMAGVPVAEVARFLGDTEKMVERVYGKHSPDYLRRAAKATETGLQATHSPKHDETRTYKASPQQEKALEC